MHPTTFWNAVRKERKGLALFVAVLLGALLFLLGGCGGHDLGPTQEIQGEVHTFLGHAGGGRVQCYTTDGTPISGASGPLNDRGIFVVASGALPERFLVVAEDVVESNEEAASGDVTVPAPLSVLVERSGLSTNAVVVTPLTSLVAAYALATEQSAKDADQDMAIFLGLWPAYSPSRLLPGLELWNFSFVTLAARLEDSRLSLEEFLDRLVKGALAGETYTCRGSGNGMGTNIMNWALEKIKDGIGEKLADAGIGWLTSLVLGEGSDRYLERLNEISQKLDKIYGEMLLMESDIKNLLQVVLLEADYKALIDAAAVIEVQYEKLESLPRYGDRQDAARIAREIVSDTNHTNVLVALKKIHHIMGGTLATSTYVHLTDHLVGQVRDGRMTRDAAFDEYERIFRYITGVQIKGLILATERHHSFFANPASVRMAVTDQLNSHINALRDQVEPFLNGVEKLNVLFTGGDSSLVYHSPSLPAPADMSRDTQYYHRFDALAGNAVGAHCQVVFRLTWDGRVARQYGGPGGKPEDYETFFTFLQDRMDRLATEGADVTLKQVNGSAIFKPITNRGSLNRIIHRFAGETETETLVRRYIFRDLDRHLSRLGGEFLLVLDGAPFRLHGAEPPVPGTVGHELNSNGKISFRLVNDAVQAEDNTPYASIALFAWLPEIYLHDQRDRWDGPMFPVLATAPAQREGGPAVYAIKSLATGAYFNEDDSKHLGACKGNWGEGQIVHKFLRYTPLAGKPTQDFLRYGDLISIYSNGLELAPVGPGQYYSTHHLKYCPRGGCGAGWDQRIGFLMRPVPTLISRFLDPEKYAIPRTGAAVSFRNVSRSNDITVTDHDWLWAEDIERGPRARFTIRMIH